MSKFSKNCLISASYLCEIILALAITVLILWQIIPFLLVFIFIVIFHFGDFAVAFKGASTGLGLSLTGIIIPAAIIIISLPFVAFFNWLLKVKKIEVKPKWKFLKFFLLVE